MLQENSDLIMEGLKPTDLVLDIGGWAHPFNRANYIMDSGPYETRGYYNRTFARNNPIPPIGGDVEVFTEQTWIQRDICDKQPYPFNDKELDFVICSHTLEDIRDPLWVCSEMIRIAKAGYIEVPSRVWESCRGSERRIAGLSHHRWLIDIDQKSSSIHFVQKFHRIHEWRYSLPKSVLRELPADASVQWLFWKGHFNFEEMTIHGDDNQMAELEQFVNSVKPYPKFLLAADDTLKAGKYLIERAVNKLDRMIR